MKNSLFLFCLLFSSFVYSQDEPVESSKIAIKITIGETITLENHSIKFVEVLEDSRCPENTTCIWAGRARVQIEIWQKGDDSILKELIFGKVNQGESDDKELFSYKDFKVIGLTLSPYPNSEEDIEGAPSVLLVYVEN